MKKTHFERIQELLSDVRNAIKAHHNLVDDKTRSYKNQMVSDQERLNENALQFETKKNRIILQGAVEYSANEAIRSLEISFADMESEIAAWIIEPPSKDFLTLMQTVSAFDLELSRDEIIMLSQASAGSYFSEKLLSGYAEKSGLRYPFQTVDSLTQMIQNAKSDAITSVQAYTGSNYKNILGMEFCTDNLGTFPSFRRIFAAEYIDRDESSLTRLEEALSTATDKTISLVPNEQQRIAKMFDDIRPEDRFDHMKQLILDHPELEKKLSVYDKTVYQKAKDEIRNLKEREYQNSLAATREASKKAAQAKAATLKAKL